nr:MAG TPA: hypothetical protein [Caudoviricetes sp.]
MFTYFPRVLPGPKGIDFDTFDDIVRRRFKGKSLVKLYQKFSYN